MKRSKHNGLAALAAVGMLCMSAGANAHLVAFGWKDLGNGTITMYGQHWHGNQSSPYSDNGGVRIGIFGTDHTSWQVFQWTDLINDMGGNADQNNDLVTNNILDGWALDPGTWSNNPNENDWFLTDPLVLGDGTWGLFTGTGCCVDTMSQPGQFVISGIGSVDPGTGPGGVNNPNPVPTPGVLALFSLGFGLLAIRRRRAV